MPRWKSIGKALWFLGVILLTLGSWVEGGVGPALIVGGINLTLSGAGLLLAWMLEEDIL